MTQYMKVLPQSNIGSHQQQGIIDWIVARVNMGQVHLFIKHFSLDIINHTSYY